MLCSPGFALKESMHRPDYYQTNDMSCEKIEVQITHKTEGEWENKLSTICYNDNPTPLWWMLEEESVTLTLRECLLTVELRYH